ncbi:MAG: flagellar biosynthesis anti-sigma factor FlgM [Fimbriimonadaceae bacterium]|nr:flagellar biosynthesis anti-sigma factor FlgM [Fimbriimonadaceae bacterium]
MQISNEEVKRIMGRGVISDIEDLAHGIDDPEYPIEPEMVEAVTKLVVEMPDREDRVAELKAKIESGQYNPTGDEIADAMIRRNIADQVR